MSKVERVKLGNVAILERKSADLERCAGQPYVSLEDIDSDTGEISVVERSTPRSTKFSFSEKHVLYGKLRPYLRKVSRPCFQGICSTDIIPIMPSSVLDRDFLFHYLRTVEFTELATKFAVGVNLPRLSPKQLSTFEIPLCTLPEQQRIAGLLDAADALRATRREALAQLDTLLQATFLDMFGDPVMNPMGWEHEELGSLIESGDRINYGVVQPGDDWPGGKPLIRVGDFVSGELELSGVKLIDPEIEKKYKRSRLNGRELLVRCVGSIGTICKVPIHAANFNIARAVARVPLRQAISRDFMVYCLRSSAVQQHFMKETRTVSQPTLNISLIKTAPVIQPPLDLQRRFAAIVESVEQQKTRMRGHLAELDALFGCLQSRGFTGEL